MFWDLKYVSSIGSLKVKCRLKGEWSGKVYVRRWCFSSGWQGLSDEENYSMCRGEDLVAVEELSEWSLVRWPLSQGASGTRWGWRDGEGLDWSSWAMLKGLHISHTIRSTWRVLGRGETQSILHSCLGGCTGSSLLHGLFSSCSERGLLPSCGAWTYCSGFSSCGPWTLGCEGFSSCITWAQESQLPGSRVWAQELRLTGSVASQHVNLARPGLEPMCLTLAGECLTTEPAGKPLHRYF